MAERAYTYEMVSTGAPVSQRPLTMEAGQLWRQYLIAGIANIAIATTGYCMGWTAPVNFKLNSHDPSINPLNRPITGEEEAWIGSLLTVGAIIGPFIAGPAASRIGRKWGLLIATIPMFLGWILVVVTTEVELLYVARMCWGVAVGMLFTVSPMYCAEIATDESRGALGSFLQMFCTIGFLLVYAAGPYVSYGVTAYIGIGMMAVFAGSFIFMPETPFYYLLKNDRESAAKSLQVLRGRSREGVEAELSKMAYDVQVSMEKTATLADVFRGSNFKAFYIACALCFFQQFCGINAVLFYMTTIFKASGTQLDAAIATIIIGTVQLCASSVTPLVVDRLGRKLLLMFSSCGTAIALALLGMFFLLQDQGSPIVESIGFIPILSLVLFVLTYCVGLGPLPWAVMGELLPMEVKATASPLATAFCWALSFLITRYFSAFAMYAAFWFFGACCVVSFVFVLLVVPETKGKSFNEIQDMLAGSHKKSGQA